LNECIAMKEVDEGTDACSFSLMERVAKRSIVERE
jgi:hypothetical protein